MNRVDFVMCPKCNLSEPSRVWDRETAKEYGVDVSKVASIANNDREYVEDVEPTFICPNCGQEIHHHELDHMKFD